jgi:hypothetical protein
MVTPCPIVALYPRRLWHSDAAHRQRILSFLSVQDLYYGLLLGLSSVLMISPLRIKKRG